MMCYDVQLYCCYSTPVVNMPCIMTCIRIIQAQLNKQNQQLKLELQEETEMNVSYSLIDIILIGYFCYAAVLIAKFLLRNICNL